MLVDKVLPKCYQRLTVCTRQSSMRSGRPKAGGSPYLRRRCSLEWQVEKPKKLAQHAPFRLKPKDRIPLRMQLTVKR